MLFFEVLGVYRFFYFCSLVSWMFFWCWSSFGVTGCWKVFVFVVRVFLIGSFFKSFVNGESVRVRFGRGGGRAGLGGRTDGSWRCVRSVIFVSCF